MFYDDPNAGTEERVWADITSRKNKSIRSVLQRWKERLAYYDDQDDGDTSDILDIVPFRMVVHKVRKMKMLYREKRGGIMKGGMKGASDASHFALMWTPSNCEDGMNEDELKDFIAALRRSDYFVNKLNEKAVYISGPSYGNEERPGDEDDLTDLVESEEVW